MTARLHGGMDSIVGTAGAVGGAVGDVIGALTGGGTGSSESRSQRIPFLVKGTTSDPRIVADVSGLAIPALMNQLRNLNVPGPTPRQHKRRSNRPIGAPEDLFKKRR